jgi:hypothetical protein
MHRLGNIKELSVSFYYDSQGSIRDHERRDSIRRITIIVIQGNASLGSKAVKEGDMWGPGWKPIEKYTWKAKKGGVLRWNDGKTAEE